jgi:hypothetical protein
VADRDPHTHDYWHEAAREALARRLTHFADHTIAEHVGVKGLQRWKLRRPGTGMYGVEVTETQGVIVLTGDAVPGAGLVLAGYGIDRWTRVTVKYPDMRKLGARSGHREVLHPEQLRAWIRDMKREEPGHAAQLDDALDALEGGNDYEAHEHLGEWCDDGWPAGYGYPVHECATLAAVGITLGRLLGVPHG